MRALSQDIRYAFRQLWSHPGFAFTAILSFALGIGATASVFSVVYAVLLHPYDYKDIDRIVSLSVNDPAENFNSQFINGQELRDIQQLPIFEKLLTWNQVSQTLTGHDLPEDVVICVQNGDAFPTLGIAPFMGRNLGPADSPDGQEVQPVVMLGYKFWQSHFQGDPSVVGKMLELDHKKYTIVGVTKPHFTWGWNTDVYMPQKIGNDPNDRFGLAMKLKPGVTYAQADAALQPLLDRFAKAAPTHYPKNFKVDVRDLSYWTVHEMGGTLYMLFAAVAMLLLIGCGNVSILLLARGTARQHEFAVRAAVGASAGRIIRQLLTESLALSLSGAGLGVLLAYGILGFIVARLPQGTFPPATDISINVPVLLFSVGLALLTGVLFGLFPALQLAKPEVSQVMQSNTKKVAGNSRGQRIHRFLIGGQIAMTLLLLTAAGAAIESFVRMMHVPLGYDPHNAISIPMQLHKDTMNTWAERVNYFELLRAKIAELPEAVSTGISANGTPPFSGDPLKFDFLGKPSPEDQKASVNFVDSGYFKTLGISLASGRLWQPSEIARGALLAVVNKTFVKRYYPEGDVLGRSVKIPDIKSDPPFRLTAPGADGWMQIIGVTDDALNHGLDKPVDPAIYVPYSVQTGMFTQVLIRTRVEPETVLHAIKEKIATVNPDQQADSYTHNLETWIKNEPEWARGSFISILFGGFSVLALILSAIGLYSVVSYSVAQRTNEFGIRMALGAGRIDVVKIVLASAGVSVGIGVLVGAALSFGLGKVIAGLVNGAGHTVLVVTGVSILLLAVALLACLIPARRASSIDPMTALRCD